MQAASSAVTIHIHNTGVEAVQRCTIATYAECTIDECFLCGVGIKLFCFYAEQRTFKIIRIETKNLLP